MESIEKDSKNTKSPAGRGRLEILPSGTIDLGGTQSTWQEEYVEEVLSRFGMSDCKPAKIPMDVNSNPSKKMSPKSKDDRAFMKDVPY